MTSETTTSAVDEPQSAGSALKQGLWFLRQQWSVVVPISLALSLPVFWHQRIEAGDLASHTYNAWLAQLIERGQAPGLHIVRQWNNILIDVALARLGIWLGFAAAEKVVVSACVVMFFWGAFTLIAATSQRAPWFLIPLIAMLTYGWTFQMGFMNYYLSLGLGFFAIALFWRGRTLDRAAGIILLGLTLLAHPMGFICVAGIATYVILAERTIGWHRWALLTATLTAIVAVHFYIVHHFRTQYWETSIFYLMNGADQLVLYGDRYAKVAMVALAFGSVALLYDRRREKDTVSRWRFRTPLELWAILLFTAAMIPELIQLPQYAGPVGLPVSRLTSITAAMGLCILGHMHPRKWHFAGFAAIAAVYFALMYQDTGTLNQMEAQAEELVIKLPYGRRVTETIWPRPDWRILFVNHMVDRACIGRCFTYSNYEPASGQFRIRAYPGSPIVADSPKAAEAMEEGKYVVRTEDLPMTQIYQCDAKDFTRLCMRDLVAGEENGRIGYQPSHSP